MSRQTLYCRRCPARAALSLAALLAALLAAIGPAAAVRVSGPGGSAEPGRTPVLVAPAIAGEQPALALLDGRIEAVDAAGRWLQLQGQPVGLHPEQLRLLGPGGPLPGGLRGLRPGQAIRFALEPEPAAALPARGAAGAGATAAGAAAPRRIVLILLADRP